MRKSLDDFNVFLNDIRLNHIGKHYSNLIISFNTRARACVCARVRARVCVCVCVRVCVWFVHVLIQLFNLYILGFKLLFLLTQMQVFLIFLSSF